MYPLEMLLYYDYLKENKSKSLGLGVLVKNLGGIIFQFLGGFWQKFRGIWFLPLT